MSNYEYVEDMLEDATFELDDRIEEVLLEVKKLAEGMAELVKVVCDSYKEQKPADGDEADIAEEKKAKKKKKGFKIGADIGEKGVDMERIAKIFGN